MMSRRQQDLQDLILDIITPKLESAGIELTKFNNSTDLLATGILDSFDFLDMISALEDRSGLVIDLAELDADQISSIRGLVENIISLEKGP